MVKRILIDCDPGIDDALSLYALLATEDVSVEGITTVFGNVTVKQATRNVGRIIALLRRPPRLRIAEGSSEPLVGSRLPRRRVHGEDGLGDLNLPVGLVPVPLLDSTSLITELLNRDAVDTVIGLGPLTNLARAFASVPGKFRRLESVIVMGGFITERGGTMKENMGDELANGEFNLASDPSAAQCVFNSQVTLRWVPLNVAAMVQFTAGDIEAFRSAHRGSALAEAIAGWLTYLAQARRRGEGTVVPDAVATALAIEPSLCRWRLQRLALEPRTRSGRLRIESGLPNAQVCEQVDAERVRQLLWSLWTKLVDANR